MKSSNFSASHPRQSRTQAVVVSIMAIVIIGFCFFGFGSKFVELVRLVMSDENAAVEGVFAVAPLANYVLASAGFLCLLGWAAANGMFRNIEGPKQTMLDSEARLDAATNDSQYYESVVGPGRKKR